MNHTASIRPGILRRRFHLAARHPAPRRGVRLRAGAPPPATPPRPPTDRHRILVVATTTDPSALAEEVRARTEEHDSDVFLICPALNSWLAHWVSDVDAAESAAQQRLEAGLTALVNAGVDARGEIGDPDPVQAIADALALHGADELVLATRPENKLHWLERHLVERAHARWAMPIDHLADAPVHEPAATKLGSSASLLAEQGALFAELLEADRRPAAAFVADATLIAATSTADAGAPLN
jgi:hypothetical protein